MRSLPVLGTYHLYAAVPPAYDTPQNPTPSPNPNRIAYGAAGNPGRGRAADIVLKRSRSFATPTFTPDRKGGGSIGVTVPAGATEAMAVVYAVARAATAPAYKHTSSIPIYTIVTHNAGAQKLTLADNLGPLTQSGKATPTICNGESYDIYAVGDGLPGLRSILSKEPFTAAADQRTQRSGRRQHLR